MQTDAKNDSQVIKLILYILIFIGVQSYISIIAVVHCLLHSLRIYNKPLYKIIHPTKSDFSFYCECFIVYRGCPDRHFVLT